MKRIADGASEKPKIAMPRSRPAFLAPRKRPPNPLNKWIKESKNSGQITRKDVAYIYRNVIFAKSFGELKLILEDVSDEGNARRDAMPAMVVAIIAGVLGDVARGNLGNLSKMLNFIFPSIEYDIAEAIDVGGYEKVKELEEAIRRLEGDESIAIVDKLLLADGGLPSDANPAR